MSSVGTAMQPAPPRKRRSPRALVLSLVVVALVLEVVHWWRNGGQDQFLLALQPHFTVTQVDSNAKTMTLSRVQESLVVSCDGRCEIFRVGKKYPMSHRGNVLEYRRGGQNIELPVLR